MRNTTRLTERILTDLKTEKGERVVWDSAVSGFGVRVRHTGRKTFIAYFRCRLNGRQVQKKISLGTYPGMQVVAARKLALSHIAKAKNGMYEIVDPEQKQKDIYVSNMTVYDLCFRWLEEDGCRSRMRGARFGELRDPKNVANDKGRIVRHIVPLIGKRYVVDLTAKH
ncbi:MAG: hypothetical protein COA69_06735, partial [Robiginitomaculum sp.]